DPGQSAAALLPRAAKANRPIFYSNDSAPRSLSGVMEVIRGKMDAAMDVQTRGEFRVDAIDPSAIAKEDTGWIPATTRVSGGPIAREFHSAQHAMRKSAPVSVQQKSMSDTLQSTFSMGSADGGSAAPDLVRGAYGQMKRFGL
ncbi:MAG: lytic transglycosylase domain-containing protein, partial [Sphingomonadaceae bacterium]|nr:lytic transglycosylase domain-containing protein [Sphingomonadaceae bacterium]